MWISFVSRLDVRFPQKVPSNIIGLPVIFYQFYIQNLFCTSQMKSSTSISFMAEMSNPTFWWMLPIESPLKWRRMSAFSLYVLRNSFHKLFSLSFSFFYKFPENTHFMNFSPFFTSLRCSSDNIISFIYSSLGSKVIKAHNKQNIIERTQTRCYTCPKLYNIMKVIFCPQSSICCHLHFATNWLFLYIYKYICARARVCGQENVYIS